MAFDLLEWVDANLDRASPSAGDEWTAECPFCGRFGSFYVNTADDGRGPYICFKCDEKSNSAVRLIAHVEGITPAEAKKMMFTGAIQLRRREATPEDLLARIKAIGERDDGEDFEAFEDSGPGMPETFQPVWDGAKWRVPKYFRDRGFKRKTLKDWKVGYCTGGFFRNRAIIPIECPNGSSFTARDLTGNQFPKYLNPKGVDHGRLLYGWNQAPLGSDFVLAEGPFDAMKLYQHGIPAMSVGGKFLRSAQVGMLFARPSSASVTIMFDPEALAEAHDAAAVLVTHFFRVRIAKLPDGIDPGDSTKRQARQALYHASLYNGNRSERTAITVAQAISKSK